MSDASQILACLERIELMLAARLPKAVKPKRSKRIAGRPDLALVPYNDVPYRAIVDAYHEMLPGQPRIGMLTPARRKVLADFYKWSSAAEGDPLETIKGTFERCQQARFLTGKPFADLFWMLEPDHLAKIHEGHYDQAEQPRFRR